MDGSGHDEGKRADGYQAVTVIPAGDLFGTGDADNIPRKEIGSLVGAAAVVTDRNARLARAR